MGLIVRQTHGAVRIYRIATMQIDRAFKQLLCCPYHIYIDLLQAACKPSPLPFRDVHHDIQIKYMTLALIFLTFHS